MIDSTVSDDLRRLSFATCLSSPETLRANLLASPCLRPGTPHQVIAVEGCPSAADGLNAAFGYAKHELLVCVHQDVYLPEGWDRCLAQQLQEAERRFGPVGVAGVYGVGPVLSAEGGPATSPRVSPWASILRPFRPTAVHGAGLAVEWREYPLAAERIGWVVDRGRMLRDGLELPARVATLDELLLVVRRDWPLRFDPALGFHLYGADICLQAAERGLAVVALGALCHHNSRGIGLPEAFYRNAEVFARKWSHRLPVATPCVIIDRGGEVRVLGNAVTRGPRSIAYALPSHPRALLSGEIIVQGTDGRVPEALGRRS
jgi:hypothetical protein